MGYTCPPQVSTAINVNPLVYFVTSVSFSNPGTEVEKKKKHSFKMLSVKSILNSLRLLQNKK